MIRITQLKLPVSHSKEDLRKKIAKSLRCSEDDFSYEIVRQSLDARQKENKKFVYTIDVSVSGEKRILKKGLTKKLSCAILISEMIIITD